MQAMNHLINSAAKTYYMSGGTLNIPIVSEVQMVWPQRLQLNIIRTLSWYSHILGLKVLTPFDNNDAKGFVESAIIDENPIIFPEHELLTIMKNLI